MAVAMGLGVVGVLRKVLGSPGRIRTDVVGYPIFEGFDVHYYFENYALAVLVFPLVTFGTFHAVTSVMRRRGWLPPAPQEPWLPLRRSTTEVAATSVEPSSLVTVTAIAAVGALWSAGAAIALDLGEGWVAVLLPVGVVLYTLAVLAGVREVARRTGASRAQACGLLNALGGAASVAVVVIASQASKVVVASTGRIDPTPVAPAVVLLVLLALVVGVVARSAVRWGAPRWLHLQRLVLLYVAGPLAIFLGTSRVAGPGGALDFFHEGEALGAGKLVAGGTFPWRDVIFIHGLFVDVGLKWISTATIGDSRWALIASSPLLIYPLFWIASYLLSVRLFRENPVFLVGTQLLMFVGIVTPDMVDARIALVPVLFLLYGRLIDRDTWARAAALTVFASILLVANPDASFVAVAALAMVMVYDVAHHVPRAPIVTSLRRTIRCVVVGLTCVVAFVAWLVAHRSLGSFISYYRIFSVDHELTGGIPILWEDARFGFWVFAPVGVILVAVWYAIARIRARAAFSTEDWIVGAAIVGLVPFYSKFLSRGDGHVYQVAGVAIVPLLWIVFRIVGWLDQRVGALRGRAASLVVLAAVVAVAPTSVYRAVADVPDNRLGQVPREAELPLLGYQVERAVAADVIRDVSAAVDELLAAGGSLFDFTNSPALFAYFVDRPLASRYFHVSMAIPKEAQEELIDELATERPELVVYASLEFGLPAWDGIANAVRHHAVSAYLLDHYRPVRSVQGYVLMLRDDLAGETQDHLYFATQPCDWGYALESLGLAPGRATRWQALSSSPTTSPVLVEGWAIDRAAGQPAHEILVTRGGVVIDRLPTGFDRPDVAASEKDLRYARAGFRGHISGLPAGASGDLRFYAVHRDGTLHQLRRGTERNERRARLVDDGGRPLPVSPSGADGNVDRAIDTGSRAHRLSLPADSGAADWIEIVAREPIGSGEITITDGDGPGHEIVVRSFPDHGSTYQIPVGSCSAWFGYQGDIVVIGDVDLDVTGVRLGRR